MPTPPLPKHRCASHHTGQEPDTPGPSRPSPHITLCSERYCRPQPKPPLSCLPAPPPRTLASAPFPCRQPAQATAWPSWGCLPAHVCPALPRPAVLPLPCPGHPADCPGGNASLIPADPEGQPFGILSPRYRQRMAHFAPPAPSPLRRATPGALDLSLPQRGAPRPLTHRLQGWRVPPPRRIPLPRAPHPGSSVKRKGVGG